MSLRTSRGWNRNRLADEARVSYPNLTKWERGEHVPKLDGLLRIARALDLCSVEEILGGPLGTQQLIALLEDDEPERGAVGAE